MPHYTICGVSSERFLRLSGHFSKYKGTVVLFSGFQQENAKTSFLWAFPIDQIVITDDDLNAHYLNPKILWDQLDDGVQTLQKTYKTTVSGFISYTMGFCAEEKLFALLKKEKNASMPLAYFQAACFSCVYTHENCVLSIEWDEKLLEFLDPSIRMFLEILREEGIQELLDKDPYIEDSYTTGCSIDDSSSYVKKIEKVQEEIRKGNVYQVNIAHDVHCFGSYEPWQIFLECAKKNPMPFSSFLCMEDYSIVSCSPERFLKKKEQLLETQPIKGTIARGDTEEKDAIQKEALRCAIKEESELLMITDLMRNDIARISIPESIEVKELRRFDGYQSVWHTSSIIQARTQRQNCIRILEKMFPGGSITGCPKMKAMELIASIEKQPRRLYTGVIGYITEGNDCDFSIAIRTIIVTKESIQLSVGAGIVIDSDPESEYKETMQKIETILKIIRKEL